jgi:hypothetical protein
MRLVQVDENNILIGKSFIIDMKVVCVEKQSQINFVCQKLTEGKIYDVISVQPYKSNIKKGISHYRVINDAGVLQSFWKSTFKEMKF